MANANFDMPARGERASPTFDKTRPRELSRFFDDLERLFAKGAFTDVEKKQYVVYYTDFETEQLWKSLKEYSDATKTYPDFKNEILQHYPDATGEYVYSIRDMDVLIGERQRLGFTNTTELSDFHLQFMSITNWLINQHQLSDLEQKRSYLRAFQPSLLVAMQNRLQMKFLQQHPNVPHEVKDVYEAARFILQSTALTGSYYNPAGAAPPVRVLQRPPTPAVTTIAESPKVKSEDLGALFSEFTKTFMDVMNQNLRGAVSNPQSSSTTAEQKKCLMCGFIGHFIDQCETVAEFITAGKCKRNQEGKVVLPQGIFVPRDIPGAWLKDRINEYHRRNPNQLAAVALMHTISTLPASTFAPTRTAYKLSAEDRIATLEAEIFDLKAKRHPPATGIRTRAQRAREEETSDEIVSPAVRQSATPEPNPRIIPAEPPIVRVEREKTPQIVEVEEEAEHPFQRAKDAAYAPPVNRNIGAPAKPPATKKPEPAYRTMPPVHDPAIAANVFTRSMEAPITITQRELLSISPEVRSQVREATTTKRVPTDPQAAPAKLYAIADDEEIVEENSTSAFAFRHATQHTPPIGATIIPDTIEAYYKSLGPGQKPDIDRLTVAMESTAIRSLFALVSNSQKIECTVDPGCQIIAMAEAECHSLGLAYDPRIRLNMESANGTCDWSLGLARNVPFRIGDITLYFQVHIINSPSYDILLGRPFDVLTESVIRNYANEDQTITITDPNTGKQATIPTFARGVHVCKRDFRQ